MTEGYFNYYRPLTYKFKNVSVDVTYVVLTSMLVGSCGGC